MRPSLLRLIPRVPAWRALARRAGALSAALLVLAGTLFSGQSYLFCLMMERPVAACCCAPERDETTLATVGASPGDAPPEIGNGCCESRAGAALTPGHASPPMPDVGPAPVSAVVPSMAPGVHVALPASPHAGWEATREHPIRAGPDTPRRALDTCVRLQVFRC